MPDLKHTSQEDSLLSGIRELAEHEFLSDCTFIAEGGERIKCHQFVLVVSSPILRSILESLDFRVSGNEAGLSIPDFHPDSIRKLLRFLYEGEVSLQKGSRTLIEFKELCNLLQINPPVNKYRSQEDERSPIEEQSLIAETEEEQQEEDNPVIPCEFCSLHLPDRSSYEAHVGDCEEALKGASFKMPDNFDLPEEIIRSAGGPPSYAEAKSPERRRRVSASSDSDGFEDILKKPSSSPKGDSPSSEKKKKFPSKLMDDLFGEDPSSSSIKDSGPKKPPVLPPSHIQSKKSPPSSSSKKEAPSSKSVSDELNEKRKRTISKLSRDSPSSLATTLKSSSSIRPNKSKWIVGDSSSESDAIDEDIDKARHKQKQRLPKKRLESHKTIISKSVDKSRMMSSSEDASDTEDSLLSHTHRDGSKRVRVSVQPNGKDTFIEYATYKLRLLCGSDEETDKEEAGGGSSSGSDSEFSSRLRRVRKKNPASYEETKWDKLKLKRLERSKSVSEIKSIIESKVMSKQQSSGNLKRSLSESPGVALPSKKPSYDMKPIVRPPPQCSSYPFKFNYGLSSENKLLEEKSKSQAAALLALSKVSFKKKPSGDPSSSSSSSSSLNPSN